MQPTDSLITIHQCLHGYADGHQLLHSSTRLSSKADQLLLTMSDMSGPSMVNGFQSYFTGYPVNETGWYAFARTWYAKEMRRPGCVWTHTLLIETADLAAIRDLRCLMVLFARPERLKRETKYDAPIYLSRISTNTDSTAMPSEDTLLAVLRGLYETPDKPVYLVADEAKEYSDLVMAIWNQQHSKLRRSFLFCSGSLSNRKLLGRSFDLQVIPSSAVRLIQREVNNGIFIDRVEDSFSTIPGWLSAAANDLLFSTRGLRSYLMMFGADAREGRAGFSELITPFIAIRNARTDEPSPSRIIGILSEYYPKPEQGSLLKQVLLGASPLQSEDLPKFSELELLLALATTKHYQSYDPEILKLRERGRKTVCRETGDFKRLFMNLLDREVNPLGDEIIAGMSDAVEPADVFDMAIQDYRVLPIFMGYNPSLSALPQIWLRSRDHQRELYDLVNSKIRDGQLDVRKVICAMLEAGSGSLAEDIIREHGYSAVSSVLGWLNSSSLNSVPREWQSSLSNRSENLIKWLSDASAAPHMMLFLANVLDPHATNVVAFGTHRWLPFAAAQSNDADNSERVRAMVFLLALSFHNPDENAPSLVAASFQRVYDAAAAAQIQYDTWRLLRYQAPPISWWRDWDKCQRLRSALVEHFIRYQWEFAIFLKAIPRAATFEAIIEDYSGKSKGRKFLRSIASEVYSNRLSATEEQRRALLRII